MDFLTFLSDYEQEDVSKVKDIFESNKAKEEAIIKEAFAGEYPSKNEALFNLDNYFIEEATAPKTIDVEYVKENIDDLRSKIEQLDEGDIRIIIHNHEDSKSDSVGFEEESKPKKGKRGRPKKTAPVNTGVVYDEPEIEEVPNEPSAEVDALVMDDNETPADDEIIAKAEEEAPKEDLPQEDDVVSEPVADEDILLSVLDGVDTGVEEEKDFEVEGKPTKLRWSDIVAQVKDQESEREGFVDKLAEMDLTEEELKQATDMAESGEIIEDDSRISTAATLIGQINQI